MTEKITKPEDLLKLSEKVKSEMNLRSGPKEMRLTVHMGTCGIAAGARDVLSALIAELGGTEAAEKVSVQQTGCAGLCDQEPMLTLMDRTGKTYRYGRLDKNRAGRIVRDHVLRGQVVNEFLIKE